MSKPKSKRTIGRTFRIYQTHDYLLNRDFGEKSSGLIRVLLSLYFNKKLENFNINDLLNTEITKATSISREKLNEFNLKLKAQALEKASPEFPG